MRDFSYLRQCNCDNLHGTALDMIQGIIDTASAWKSDTEKVSDIRGLFEVLEEIEFERRINR